VLVRTVVASNVPVLYFVDMAREVTKLVSRVSSMALLLVCVLCFGFWALV